MESGWNEKIAKVCGFSILTCEVQEEAAASVNAKSYSLFHANLDERKQCHLALRPDKSILKEVPDSKYAPILSCKISWAWDKDSALHINLKLMSFFWMGGGRIIASGYGSRWFMIKIELKSTSWPNEIQRNGQLCFQIKTMKNLLQTVGRYFFSLSL